MRTDVEILKHIKAEHDRHMPHNPQGFKRDANEDVQILIRRYGQKDALDMVRAACKE